MTAKRALLFTGGNIRTMAGVYDAQPQALLVQDGRIAALGDTEELAALAPEARRIDLAGATLMPAFVDAHSHLSSYAASLLQVDLSAARNVTEVVELVQAHIARQRIKPGVFVLGRGYDNTRFPGMGHPARTQLDAAAPQNPLLIQHVSGHVGVANTAALQQLDITPQTPSPRGGRIRWESGYLEETAFIQAMKQLPPPDAEDLLRAYAQAQKVYASYGITTVQEGLMPAQMIAMYRALLQSGLLKLDVVGFVEPDAAEEYRRAFPESWKQYYRHFKIGGYKIVLDGSPQARTAWLTRPYLPAEDAETTRREALAAPDSGWCGQPAMTDEAVKAAARKAATDGMQLLAHCNGDAAAQQFLDGCAAAEAAEQSFRSRRPVMIHAQLLRPDQLPLLKKLGVIPSFFVAHVWHWGDVHLRNLGPERAAQISPAGSALALELPFTFHQDAPVLPPDMLQTVQCAVQRRTGSGQLLGENQCISVYDALRAVTSNVAYQYFEENEKGTLEQGKRADLILLEKDPLAVPTEELAGIRVLATWKDGEPVFLRDAE